MRLVSEPCVVAGEPCPFIDNPNRCPYVIACEVAAYIAEM
jgi:hypothetical protein